MPALARTGRLIRVGITLGLLIVLGLVCWPARPAGDRPDGDSHQKAVAIIKNLRGSLSVGSDATAEIKESEISGYITRKLVKQEKPGGLLLHLREVVLDISSDRIEVWMKNELLSIPLTYTFQVTVSRENDGRHRFDMGRLQIGHLPLPGRLSKQARTQLAAAFGRLDDEINFINMLPSIMITDGAVNVSTLTAENKNPEALP